MSAGNHDSVKKKPPYEIKLINGVQGDPGLFCFSPATGDGCLFDAGALEELSNRDLLKVRNVFVTHAHIDHLIGFDRFIRVNIPHGRPLNFFGPPSFAKNIQGKLRGFLWNLLEPGQLSIFVSEIDREGVVSTFQLKNDDHFALHPASPKQSPASFVDAPEPVAPVAAVARLSDQARVEAVVLDHGTPVVGYCVQGPRKFRVKPESLERLGLTPGPWLGELQHALASSPGDSSFELAGNATTLSLIAEKVFESSMRRPLAYLTDFIFSRANLDRIVATMQDVEVLYCEATFKDSHIDRAAAKKHLTTRQSALIARLLKAKELRIFHISNIYHGDVESVLTEASDFFAAFTSQSDAEVTQAVAAEFERLDISLLSPDRQRADF